MKKVRDKRGHFAKGNMPWNKELLLAYCFKCRQRREIKDPKQVTLKNGKPAITGTCPVCGSKLYRERKMRKKGKAVQRTINSDDPVMLSVRDFKMAAIDFVHSLNISGRNALDGTEFPKRSGYELEQVSEPPIRKRETKITKFRGGK